MSDDADGRKKLLASAGVPFGSFSKPNDHAPFARHVVLVTSGKGGVGKSTVAVNLASVYAQRDWRVGLLDADVHGPSIPRMLSLTEEELRWNDADRIQVAENFGIRAMSVGMTTPTADTPLIWRASVATSAMIQLLDDVDWGPLDVLVIDMPPGTGDTQITMLQEVHVTAAVVVTTPQAVATDDVRRAIRMLREVRVPVGGVVENMSGPLFGEGGGRALAEAYGVPFLGTIPLELAIRESSDQGRPLAATGTPAQRAYYQQIADGLGLDREPTGSP